MLTDKSTQKTCKPVSPKNASKMLTMQQAMEYLNGRGIPCKSRATFYRILEDFDIPFVVINPNGAHKVRRFTLDGLNTILKSNNL